MMVKEKKEKLKEFIKSKKEEVLSMLVNAEPLNLEEKEKAYLNGQLIILNEIDKICTTRSRY